MTDITADQKESLSSGEVLSKRNLQYHKEKLDELFDARDIEYHRVDLWHWIKATTSGSPWSFRGNPATVLHLQKTFSCMIDYSWQLLQEEGAEKPPLPFSEERIRQEKDYMAHLDHLIKKYKGTIRRLTKAETDQPLRFIRRFFAYQTKKEWKELLDIWAEYSLTNASAAEWSHDYVDLEAYELLEGLLEALHLLHFRDQPAPDHLDPLVQLIVEVLSPEMVFSVSHPAVSDDDDPYTDLLIVISDSRQKPLTDFQPIVELVTVRKHRMSCSLHTSSHIYERLKAGHIYFSLICNRKNLVYSNGVRQLPEPPADFSTVLESSRQVFDAGYHKAHSFYESALRQEDRPLAAFMLQQAAELTYRTLARALYGCEKKTHNFAPLRQLNRRIAPSLNAVFPADTPEEKRLLQLLEDAYTQGRYADNYEISEEDLKILQQRVGLLLSRSGEIFSERMAVITNDQDR